MRTATRTRNTDVIRVNFTIPRQLVKELRKEVPYKGKSRFIAEAVEEKIAHLKRVKALKELAKLPPTFTDIKDGAEYISKIRTEEDKERSERLGL